ncbi:MAG: phosphotransferase [Pseudomonadota bacterium]
MKKLFLIGVIYLCLHPTFATDSAPENLQDERQLNTIILCEVAEILKKRFETVIKINSYTFLSDPDRRNSLVRITLEGSSPEVPKNVIFKQSLPKESDEDNKGAFARFAREWAVLEFLSGVPNAFHSVPQLYGGSKENKFVLIEDLGEIHVSLVDSLTLPGEQKAIESLQRYMKALGSFHASSFRKTDRYCDMLNLINENNIHFENDIVLEIKNALPAVYSVLEKLGLALTTELKDEIVMVIESMIELGPFTVLTHGDLCPDNVFDNAEKGELRLIDFELASVGNALLDGVYLRMSMPTGWCAKAIPDELIAQLETIYRDQLRQTIPAADNDAEYNVAYTNACAYWSLFTILEMESEDVWEQEKIGESPVVLPGGHLWKPEDNFMRPRLISRLQAFVAVTEEPAVLPHLRQLAQQLLDRIQKRWPDAKALGVYPAFE